MYISFQKSYKLQWAQHMASGPGKKDVPALTGNIFAMSSNRTNI